MHDLASERTLLHWTAFAVLFSAWPRLYLFSQPSWFQDASCGWLMQIQSLCARSRLHLLFFLCCGKTRAFYKQSTCAVHTTYIAWQHELALFHILPPLRVCKHCFEVTLESDKLKQAEDNKDEQTHPTTTATGHLTQMSQQKVRVVCVYNYKIHDASK